MATITCRDCGTQRQRCPRNTRYCKSCRLLRDVAFWRRQRRSCRECGSDFAPLGRTDYWCSTCDPGLLHLAAPCVLAPPNEQHTGPPAITGLPVCAVCLRSPRMRSRLVNALQGGQTKRRKTNNWRPDADA